MSVRQINGWSVRKIWSPQLAKMEELNRWTQMSLSMLNGTKDVVSLMKYKYWPIIGVYNISYYFISLFVSKFFLSFTVRVYQGHKAVNGSHELQLHFIYFNCKVNAHICSCWKNVSSPYWHKIEPLGVHW